MEPDWRVVGAAVQGSSHLKQGTPCQDALQYRTLAGGVLLTAVADGAGSAARSEAGARAAVEAALDSLASNLAAGAECCAWVDLFWQAFEQARAALEQLAEQSDAPLRAFATTLICVAATAERLVIGQLGDGAVIVRSAEGLLATLTSAQRGEYANETYFLTQAEALEHLEIQVIDGPVQALAVMSDGLIRLALKRPSNEPHAPFFKPLFAFVEAAVLSKNGAHADDELASFLRSPRVCERTDDDKALVLAIRRP